MMTSIVQTGQAHETALLFQHADDFQSARADRDFLAQGRFVAEQICRHVVARSRKRAGRLRFFAA